MSFKPIPNLNGTQADFAGSITMSGLTVATQSWVSSQNYLTSETDDQTLDEVLAQGNTSTRDISVYEITGSNLSLGNGVTDASIFLDGESGGGDLTLQNGGNNQDIFFKVNDGGVTTTPLMIDGSASRVGVGGVTSPSYDLHVTGSLGVSKDSSVVRLGGTRFVPIYANNSNGYAHAQINGFEVGGTTNSTNEGYIKTADNSRKLFLDTNGWRFVSNHTEYARVTSDGKVGIGTSSPSYKLHVNGDVKINTIAAGTTDTDKFLISDGGIIKYRNGSQVLSDIGGLSTSSASSTYLPLSGGTLTGNVTFPSPDAINFVADSDTGESHGITARRTWKKSVSAGNLQKLGKWTDTEGTVQMLITVGSETGGNSGTSTYLWGGGYNSFPLGYRRLRPLTDHNGHGNGADNGTNDSWHVYLRQESSFVYSLSVAVPTGANNKNLRVTCVELAGGNDFTDMSSDSALAMSGLTISNSDQFSLKNITASSVTAGDLAVSGGDITLDGTATSTLTIGTSTSFGRELTLSTNGVNPVISAENELTIKTSNNHTKIKLEGGGSTDNIQFIANQVEQVRITTAGVGIGTTSPSQALDVIGYAKADRYVVQDGSSSLQRNGSILRVYSNQGTDFSVWLGGFHEALSIRKSATDGLIGINDTTPSYQLDVNGTGRFVNDLYVDADLDVTGDITMAGNTVLTGIASSDVTGALGYTPVDPSNTGDFVTSSETGSFLTDYTVTEADVTGHQAALTITESQISDLGSYLTSVSESDVTQHEGALTLTSGQITGALGFSPISTETDNQTLDEVLTQGNTSSQEMTVGKVEAEEFIGNLRGAVSFTAQAEEALTKGDVVYISGVSGNKTVVAKADADDSSKMPAFGVANETVNANADVTIVNFGAINNLDTDTPNWDEGDELYVSNTAGTLSNTAPSGEGSQIQKMAKVTKRHASTGSITVMGAGRTNAVPNLNEGRLFVGNSSNQAVADDTAYVDIANSRVGIGTTSPSQKLHVEGITYSTLGFKSANGYSIGALGYNSALRFNNGNILVNNSSAAEFVRFDATNSRVGIGTSSPNTKLQVVGTVQAWTPAGDAYSIAGAGATDGNYRYAGLRFDRTNNVAKFGHYLNSGLIEKGFVAVKDDGNVGIGTASPSYKLDVAGNVAITYNTGYNTTPTDGALVLRNTNSQSAAIGVTSDSNLRIKTQSLALIRSTGQLWFGRFNLDSIQAYTTDFAIFTAGDVERLRINKTTGNVGIGTTNPQATLQIDTPAANLAGQGIRLNRPSAGTHYHALELATNGTVDWSVGQNSNDAFEVYENGAAATARLTIKEGGNVGIGTTSPTQTLHVEGSIFIKNNSFIRSKDGGATVYDLLGVTSGGIVQVGQPNRGLKFRGGGVSSDIDFELAGSTKFILKGNTGNVGIGTNSPSEKLDVAGNAKIGSATQSGSENAKLKVLGGYEGGTMNGALIEANGNTSTLILRHTGTASKCLYIDGTQVTALTSAIHIDNTDTITNYLQFRNNSSNVFTVSANGDTYTAGKVGIGTTSPSCKLHIKENGYGFKLEGLTDGKYIRMLGNGSDAYIDAQGQNFLILNSSGNGVKVTSGSAATRLVIGADSEAIYRIGNTLKLRTNSADRLFIDSSGNVGIGTNSPSKKLDVVGDIKSSATVEASGLTLTSLSNQSSEATALVVNGNNQIGYRELGSAAFSATSAFATAAQGTSANTAFGWGNHASAGYAPLASPALTGNPTAPTQSSSENSTKIATTAYVKSQGYLTSLSNALLKTGGTMSGAIAMGSNNITGGGSFYANLFSVGNEGKVVSTSTQGLQLQATAGSKPITFYTNVGGNTERMRITHDGNVGIGTTAPDSKLHVVGSVDSDAASLGSEIVASQTASGTNWSGSSLASGYTHSAGSTDLLVSNLTPIINRLYRVEIQTTNVTAGRLDKVIFGGVETTVYINSNLTRVLSLKATTSTGPLTFQCQSGFVGTVTVSSVKEIVASDSLSVLTNSGGNRLETRVFGATDFFLGDSAGENRVSSSNNIGIGYGALSRIATAGINLAIGNRSLSNLTNGSYNVAIGHDILGNYQKNGNVYNIGIGNSVMSGSSMTGSQNIIMGFWAGPDMTSASGNLGIGYSVFGDLTSGGNNLSLGNNSLRKATSGGANIALGGHALNSLTTTSHNIAIGYLAGRYAIGNAANETPSQSIYIGYNTKASANGESNQIVIGYNAEGIGANTVTLGNDSVVTTALKGDVGIGTTSPSAKLHAYQTISTAPSIVSRVPYKTNADAQLKQRAALRIDINEGSSSLSIGGIGSAHGGFIQSYATNSTSTHRNFVLNPFGGNVGIGFGASAAPTEKLHVNGTFKSTGASYFDSTIEVGSSSAGGVILTSPGGGRFLVTINNSGELQSSSL